MNIMDEIKRLDACTSIKEIEECKKDVLTTMEIEHQAKMHEIASMKARHEAEHDELAKSIREALGSGDFSKVQELLKKQTELLEKHGAEILSI